MGSPLPEDPYAALGVARDASAAAIKTRYRKLVLKCHPDKVQDEAKKADAVDNFHKIQTAYEVIGDEDRRARYDAQVKLAQLRKDVMNRQGADGAQTADVRTTTTRTPPDASKGSAHTSRGSERPAKVSPQYEERKPAYATQPSPADYFDSVPRPTPQRKDSEYERTSKRPAANRRESERDKVSPRDAKENERAQQKERSRQTEREIKRSWDRKQSYAPVEDQSDSDEQVWQRRRVREEDLRRAYHQEAHREDARRSYYDEAERARKVLNQYDAAREHIDSRKKRQDSERRPSPVRMNSSKEKVPLKKSEKGEKSEKSDKDKSSLFFRWGSGKPKSAGRDSFDRTAERRAEREAVREQHRRSSADEVDGYRRGATVEESRRPQNLQHSKSSPANIHIPDEPKSRAKPVQAESQESATTPKIRRAETMPSVPGRDRDARRKETLPRQASALRQTEVVDGLATPAATPENPEVKPSKYHYRREYADDNEYPTPDGYRTEERIPERAPQAASTKTQRYTRSPSPVRPVERGAERERERARVAPARYAQTSPQRPAAVPRTTSTTYHVYKNDAATESRPVYSRENSGRMDEKLYGEIYRTRSTRSPRQDSMRQAPPEPEHRESPRYRAEDVRMASGYETSSRRRSMAPQRSYSRTHSGNPVYVRA